MARPKKVVAPAGDAGEEETPKAKAKNSVDVLNPDGTFLRSYSKEKHGDDYRALADEFASKVKDRTVVATK